jgi:hypothetical protein
VDTTFDAGLNLSSVFCLVPQGGGQILVGGWLSRRGASNGAPVLRLNSDLQWDESFRIDAIGGTPNPPYAAVYSLVTQPDGKLLAGGYFFEVGGYWRRNIVRFARDGHVDGCFDLGLGVLEVADPGPVRSMVLQPDGRILVGGAFVGVDTAIGQRNPARLLPQSGCDQIRVYLEGGDYAFAAATFPPGGTNYLELSADLRSWRSVVTNTSPYIWCGSLSLSDPPRAFFRARQER